MVLSLEERTLIALVRSQITGEKLILPDEWASVDWREVMCEAKQQAVVLLAFEAASQIQESIPVDVFEEWTQDAYATLSNNMQVTFAQNELVSWLNEKGFPYIILKGLSAAADYLRPDLRMLGDVDFLIDTNNQAATEELLKLHGFQRGKGEHSCHVAFSRKRTILEMHFEIAGIPFGEKGEWVRAVMADALSAPRTVTLDDAKFAAPDEVRHGLILLLHMQGHMLGEGLGLRHLCDWGCFVQKTADKAFWEKFLLPFLKKLGLFRYAATMTHTAALYLGTPNLIWADAVEDALCADVMHDIFESGNFGRKDRVRARSGMLVSQHGRNGTGRGTIYNLYQTLHNSTVSVYPIVKRVRVLHPILDAARAVRYLYFVAIGKRPSLTDMAPKATQRKSLYEKLRIYETEE